MKRKNNKNKDKKLKSKYPDADCCLICAAMEQADKEKRELSNKELENLFTRQNQINEIVRGE